MEIEERIKAVEVVAPGMDPPVVADASTVLREVVRQMRDERSGRAPETIELESSLAQAFHRMMVSDRRYLPLVDDEERPVQSRAGEEEH